jgi:rod shape-determining protein MreC
MNMVSLRQTLSMIAVFAVISVGFIVLDRRSALEPIRDGLNQIMAPVSDTFYRFADGPDRPSGSEDELARVTQERDALKAENSKLKADNRELEQLRQQLDVTDRNPTVDYTTAASVIGYDATGAQRFILIDKGSNDGIEKGMAIVSPYFYLGQVSEVTQDQSKVMLIIDTSQSVGAMLEDTRSDGVVYGQAQAGGYLVMSHVDSSTVPKEGEWIMTSSSAATQTRQVPPNIPIGQVLGVPISDPQTDTLEIQIRPGVSNFDDLDVVFVAKLRDDG